MKITPKKIIKISKNFHSQFTKYLFFYKKLKIEELDFNKIKKIEVVESDIYEFFELLCIKFKLTLTISFNDLKVFYKSGLLTYKKSGINGIENWEYNKSRLKIFYKNSIGIVEKYEYDNHKRLIHVVKYCNQNIISECEYKFDKFGNLIYENVNKQKQYWKYDKTGKILISYKNSFMKKIYNSSGVLIYEKSKTEETSYNEFGKILVKKIFDRNDNLIIQENYKYNENNKLINFNIYSKCYEERFDLSYKLEN